MPVWVIEENEDSLCFFKETKIFKMMDAKKCLAGIGGEKGDEKPQASGRGEGEKISPVQ